MWARTILFASAGVFAVTLAVMQLLSGVERAPSATPAQSAAPAKPSAMVVATTPRTTAAGGSMITRGTDGHFHAQVQLNGQPVEMLVDTGASLVALPERLAQRMGIAPDPAQYTGRARTANGEVAYAPITLEVVRVGSVERRGVAAAVMRDNSLPTPLLGQSFLSSLSETTIRGDTMTIQ